MKNQQIFQRSIAGPETGAGISKKIKAGIVGGAGYTGGELIRILLHHAHTEIVFVQSTSNAGKYIHQVHTDLLGETALQFSDKPFFFTGGDAVQDELPDVLFLCAAHGAAKTFVEQNNISDTIKVIDLSQDFRLNEKSETRNRKFIYGLPEINKEKIKNAHNIANPGCFATAIQLGLLPLAKAGLLNDVYTTGITGSTGAGQSLSATSHFSWRANNIQAYKTLTHQHLHEVYQSLHQLQPTFPGTYSRDGGGGSLNFVPWRGDFTRGIFISSQLHCDLSGEELKILYNDFYKDHPFTFVSNEPISLKQVVNTNKCVIQLEKAASTLVVHSAIDNLIKGASGQAVQNMNILFGLDETTGLNLKANYF